MTLTDSREAELRSFETANLLNANKLMKAFALASSVLAIPSAPYLSSSEFQSYARGTSATYRTVRVSFNTQDAGPKLEAKTDLARRLLELRMKAIDKGMPLLSQEDVLAEVRRRRDENA